MCQAYERASCILFFPLRANVVPVSVQLLPIRKDADGHWPLRPGIRARRLWCRHGGRSARPSRPRHRRPRPHRPGAPGPPWRLRRRGQHRRRRRHPGADPAPLPCRPRPRRPGSRCPTPAATRSVSSSCPTDADDAREGPHRRGTASAAEEGLPVLGWRTVPTESEGLGQDRLGRHAASSSSSSWRRPASGVDTMALERRAFVLRKRAEHAVDDAVLPLAVGRAPSSTRACSRPSSCASSSRTCATRPSSRAWRSCTRASRPTRSRAGRWRTRTAISATTARSTRSPGTATGCEPARRCSRRP